MSTVNQGLLEIYDFLSKENKYDPQMVESFVEKLALLEDDDQLKLCLNIDHRFFSVVSQEPVRHLLMAFLGEYEKMVCSGSYSWAFAETIAKNMRVIFESTAPFPAKGKALALAIEAAGSMNRFAAMDTCFNMVYSVEDEELGIVVGDVIKAAGHRFLQNLEKSSCNCDTIRKAVLSIKETSQ